MNDWEAALVSLEQHLDAAEEALDGREGLPIWLPPTAPLPIALLGTATHLLERSQLLAGRYQERLDMLRNTLHHGNTQKQPREHAQILDRKA